MHSGRCMRQRGAGEGIPGRGTSRSKARHAGQPRHQGPVEGAPARQWREVCMGPVRAQQGREAKGCFWGTLNAGVSGSLCHSGSQRWH